jgi:hypothetical protein
MRKLIVLSAGDDYDVGGLVRYLIKMFENPDIIKLFNENGFEIITSKIIKEELNKTETEFLQNIKENEIENYLIFGIHPYGMHTSINSNTKIKKIAWINDPHYFAHYVDRGNKIVQNYYETYDPTHLNQIDYLVTPSPIYFKNLNINKYDEKIKYFFYFLNEDIYNLTGNLSYGQRLDKIVLSGAIGGGYLSRIEFDKLRLDITFNTIIDKVTHPGYKNNKHMTELNYYNELTKYKAAFVGHHSFPINFLLAKHIEVLMCGCLGFFEPNVLLEKELGLIESKHYVSCFDENGLIKDPEFYTNWMKSEKGIEIAKNGKKYVREKFGKNYIKEFIDFLQKIN